MSYGLALIYGVLKIINLANAGFLMLGAYVTWWLFTAFNVHPLLAPLVIVPAFFLLGWALERTLVRRVLGAEPIISLLLLFGVWLVLQNLAYVIWTGDTRSIEMPFIEATVAFGGLTLGQPRIYVFVMGVLILVALQLFLTRTHLGRAIRATAQDRDAARLVGVDVDRVMGIAFGIGIALAGFGGSLLSLLFSFTPDFGRALSLKSFCIVVLGGLDSIVGRRVRRARALARRGVRRALHARVAAEPHLLRRAGRRARRAAEGNRRNGARAAPWLSGSRTPRSPSRRWPRCRSSHRARSTRSTYCS